MCVILAFVLSFHLLFSHDERFLTLPGSILATIVLMIGEFEYKDLFSQVKAELGTTSLFRYSIPLFVTISRYSLVTIMLCKDGKSNDWVLYIND
jgi:hypothetical protein